MGYKSTLLGSPGQNTAKSENIKTYWLTSPLTRLVYHSLFQNINMHRIYGW